MREKRHIIRDMRCKCKAIKVRPHSVCSYIYLSEYSPKQNSKSVNMERGFYFGWMLICPQHRDMIEDVVRESVNVIGSTQFRNSGTI